MTSSLSWRPMKRFDMRSIMFNPLNSLNFPNGSKWMLAKLNGLTMNFWIGNQMIKWSNECKYRRPVASICKWTPGHQNLHSVFPPELLHNVANTVECKPCKPTRRPTVRICKVSGTYDHTCIHVHSLKGISMRITITITIYVSVRKSKINRKVHTRHKHSTCIGISHLQVVYTVTAQKTGCESAPPIALHALGSRASHWATELHTAALVTTENVDGQTPPCQKNVWRSS
jgi:hypothetical protein